MTHRTIEINNKEYKLRYDFNAVCEIEEKSGKSIMHIASTENMGVSTIRLLLWGGLKHNNEGMTVKQAGELIQEYMNADGELENLVTKITEAITESGAFGKNLKAGEK